ACRAALGARGVAHLNCPNDWQDQSGDAPSPMNVTGHTSKAWSPPIVVPQRASLEVAAAVLNGGQRTVILVGQGALGAGDEVEQAADLLGAPVVKALLGKAVVPDDSTYCT